MADDLFTFRPGFGLATLASILGVLIQAGCDSPANESASVSFAAADLEALRASAKSKVLPPREMVLQRDFGLVSPGSKLVHRFPVVNNDNRAWTIRRVVTACACTVPYLSAETIEAGATEEVEVLFSVGPVAANHNREIRLEFAEVEAPVVRMVVKAYSRNVLTLMPERLDVGEHNPERVIERTFELHNFGDEDWPAPDFRSSASWCRIETCRAVDVATIRSERPRQAWHVVAQIDTGGLADGRYSEEIVVFWNVDEPPAKPTRLPIALRVSPAVEAAPRQLFFGELLPGDTVTKTVRILFRADSIPAGVDALTVVSSAPRAVSLRWQRSSGRVWELAATFQMPADERYFDSVVEIRQSESHELLLSIPCQARVQRP